MPRHRQTREQRYSGYGLADPYGRDSYGHDPYGYAYVDPYTYQQPRRSSGVLGCLGVLVLSCALAAGLVFVVLPSLGHTHASDATFATLTEVLEHSLPGSVQDRPVNHLDELAQQEGLAYRALTAGQQRVYLQTLAGILSLSESFEVVDAQVEDIEPAIHAVMIDHPELFWVDGSTRYTYREGGGPIAIHPGFSVPLDEVEVIRRRIEAEADGFLATIPADADQYTIAKMAYEYVIRTTDYVDGSSQNQNIQSVFLNHASVCAGYARAYQYLLQRAGVFCSYVEGTIPSRGEDHAWNIALLDGVYTFVDVTWGDPTYAGEEDRGGNIIFDYMGLTTDELMRDDHQFDNATLWPTCASDACDYYRREGLVFDYYDRAALSNSFWEQRERIAQAGTNDPIVFKFSNVEAYAQARDDLIRNEFLTDDLESAFGVDTQGGSYQFQYLYSDSLYILKLYL